MEKLMKYKMVAVDLDDTILHKDKTISEYTKAVFEKLSENVKIVVATSRAIQRAGEYAKQLHASALVSLNGAVVYDEDNLIKTTPISEEVVRSILSDLSQMKPIELSIVKPEVVYTTDQYFIDRGESLPIDLANYDANEVQRIYATTPKHKMLHALPLNAMGLKLIQSQPKNYPDFHTIVRQEVNKAEGLKILCERFNILPEEIVAFGDEENDLEMLQFAGCGVAMGNAIETLKAQANDVTVTNEEDGVAKWIEAHWDLFFGSNDKES